MEQLSKCCGKKSKIIDNWASTNDRDDVRFTYVCSECGKDFIVTKLISCPTCNSDLPPNHFLRK